MGAVRHTPGRRQALWRDDKAMRRDPEPRSRCYCTTIRRAARHVTRFYDSCLADCGLRVTQYSILGSLKHHGPMTMLQLAHLLTMDRATIGHNLRPLERHGLVAIRKSEQDRRARIVSVTDAGLQRIARGKPGWDRAQAEFERLFGSAKLATLRRMMDQVVEQEFAAAA